MTKLVLSPCPLWVEEFKIDMSIWESLAKQATTQDISPLALACEQGFIDETAYLQWEQTRSKWPSLSRDFFSQQPKEEILKKYDIKKFKKAGAIPIGEWDGHCYFATISSESSEFNESLLNAIFVLAPWSGMKKWYAHWQKQQEPVVATDPLPIENVTATLTKIDFSEIALPVPPKAQPTPSPAVEPPPQPQKAPPPQSTKSFPIIDVPDLGIPEPSSAISPDLGGLNLETPKLKSDVLKDFDLKSLTSAPVLETMPLTTVAPPPIPPTITSPSETDTHLTKITSVPTVPIDQVLDITKQASSMEHLCDVILGAWKNYFTQSMILTLKSDVLTSFKQIGPWKFQSGKEISIILDKPSIFKIVVDTSHAYHGYVIENHVNKEFFSKSTEGLFPEHVTLLPLIVNGAVFGIIYGSCTKEVGKNISLSNLENIASGFSEQLTKLVTGIKKAS